MAAKANLALVAALMFWPKYSTNVPEHLLSVTATRTALALATLGAMREIEMILFVLQHPW
jgi:hypothetical protein